MRTPNGRVKVFDFGIAKVSAACFKSSFGTPLAL